MRFIGWLVVLLGIAGSVAYFLGWIDFAKNPQGVSVEVDKDKFKQDLNKLEEGANKVGKNVSDAIKGSKSVSGKLSQLEEKTLTVAPASGPVVSFHIQPDTKITREGKAIPLGELKEGEGVKVTYKEEGDKNLAVTVSADSP
ncbi:MAG: hypothetical protein AB7K24_16985 [Gemmataceae bacterium]